MAPKKSQKKIESRNKKANDPTSCKDEYLMTLKLFLQIGLSLLKKELENDLLFLFKTFCKLRIFITVFFFLRNMSIPIFFWYVDPMI